MSQERKIELLRGRLASDQEARCSSGEGLIVDGVPVGRLAEAHGTPLYVYGCTALKSRTQSLMAALGGAAEVYYSVKANPSLGICEVLASQGLGAEVASGGELILAGEAGFPAERTLFAGPGKSCEELLLAASRRIEAINVESMGELERVSSIGNAMGGRVRVALRVNPARASGGARMRMGGATQQFGIPEEDLPWVIQRLPRLSGVELVGLHVYVGTQMFEANEVIEHVRQVVSLAKLVVAALGRPLSLVDLGGGLGIPYFEGTSELDLAVFGAGVRKVIFEAREEGGLDRARFVFELGRYVVAECGVYVARVLDVKKHRGKTFVVTDGGMHHNVMATGNFGQVFKKPYPIACVGRARHQVGCERGVCLDEEEEAGPRGGGQGDAFAVSSDTSVPLEDLGWCSKGSRIRASVVGPCCTPLDVLAHDISLPVVAPGDLIGVFYSGAYGYSASSLSFLSHPTPAEILVDRGKEHVLRERGTMDQVLRGQSRLDPGQYADVSVG